MSRPNNERNVQFYLILANLPASVLRQRPGESWKAVKDLIYSHIHCEDREYGRVDIADGIALCRMHDIEQRREAYGCDDYRFSSLRRLADTDTDALQGMSWRNMTLKAWLCEKRGRIMEQSAGPVDRQTGDIIPAPGHLLRMTPSLARRIGCIPLARPLPSPPLSPQHGVRIVPSFAVDEGFGSPYKFLPRQHIMSSYDVHMVGQFPEMASAPPQKSSNSGMPPNSAALSLDSAQPRFREAPRPPGTPFVSQAASSSGRASASGSSSFSITSGRPLSTTSSRSSVSANGPGVIGYNKIQIQSFNREKSIPDVQHYLERTLQLYVLRKKTCKGNGRNPRVFITFHTNEDANIAVQHLNGRAVYGRKLIVSLDLQSRWHSLAMTGKSSKWTVQNPLLTKRPEAVKLSNKPTARKDNTARKGPVIIDGSQE